ncbi:MAG: Ig-like domain-containing protein [Vicinamibacterales bacterium]
MRRPWLPRLPWLPPSGGRVLAALFLICLAGAAFAQAPARRLTTVESIRQFPGFYHLQNVLVRGELVESNQRIVLRADDRDMSVMLGENAILSGLLEARATVLDVGRLERGDPRLSGYDAPPEGERWPQPGEELLLRIAGLTQVDTFTTATPRALALEPWKFEGQTVTVTGQFRGRNLFGDAPSSPGQSQYDFVLRAGDGTVWVTGLRPRGRGFNLDVDARVDTNRWLEVTGVVRRVRTMVTIEAKTLAAATAPAEALVEEEAEAPPPPPTPAEVIFSTPTADETNVGLATPVRLQFSRGLDTATVVPENFRVAYSGAAAILPAPAFEVSYDAGNSAVTLRFMGSVERFSTITVETLPGLKAFDGAPVTPWRLTFSIGG